MSSEKEQIEAVIVVIVLCISIAKVILPLIFKRMFFRNKSEDYCSYILDKTKNEMSKEDIIEYVHKFPEPRIQVFVLSFLFNFPAILVIYALLFKDLPMYGIAYCGFLYFLFYIYYPIYIKNVFSVLIITNNYIYNSSGLWRVKIKKYDIKSVIKFEVVDMLQARAYMTLDRVKMILDDGRWINFWFFGSSSISKINDTLEMIKSRQRRD